MTFSHPALSDQANLLLGEMYGATALIGTETGGRPSPIDTSTMISVEQGSELNRLLRETGCAKTLEIGLAYGYSTIWILDALKPGGSHIAVDPFQLGEWRGIGLHQAKRLGNKVSFALVEDYSIHALSDLIRRRESFDLIFIDGNHRYDDVLVDFYLADQLLKPGALLAFDDMWMPSIRTVMDFIRKNRAYEIVDQSCSNMRVWRKLRDDDRPWDQWQPFTVDTGKQTFARRVAGGLRRRAGRLLRK